MPSSLEFWGHSSESVRANCSLYNFINWASIKKSLFYLPKMESFSDGWKGFLEANATKYRCFLRRVCTIYGNDPIQTTLKIKRLGCLDSFGVLNVKTKFKSFMNLKAWNSYSFLKIIQNFYKTLKHLMLRWGPSHQKNGKHICRISILNFLGSLVTFMLFKKSHLEQRQLEFTLFL